MRQIISEFLEALVDENNNENPTKKIINEYCVQFYLAMHLAMRDFTMTLEQPFQEQSLDLVARNNGDNRKYVIELKCCLVSGGYTASMRSVWDDLNRLEKLKSRQEIEHGYFIMVTNNRYIWSGQGDPQNQAMYKCFHGNEINIVGIEGLGNINRNYSADWFPARDPQHMAEEKFRYFVVEV